MGRSDSKYSKKKKVSSEGRRKKKIKHNKSKKLRRHNDSFSSSSDDESTSSLSLTSSSSSEDEYKSKRSRSRARNEVKSSKKRSRKRSSSEESREESPPVKKRKRSKKKSDLETKKRIKKDKKDKKIKKMKKKKKSRKDDYISSASDSESCSTCKDEDSHSNEGVSNRKSRRKMGTRSFSPSKLSDSYDDENIDEMMTENNSRRLKSVITVVKPLENEEEEEDEMKKDELKEEIVYDYDDYPSSKSNDSNDGEKTTLTSVIAEVNSASSLNVSANIGSEVSDLESVLRRKALENLSRFRGEIQTKPSADNKHKSGETVVKKTVSVSPVSQPVIPKSRFTWRRDASVSGPHAREPQIVAPKVNTGRVETNVVNETTKTMADEGTDVDQKSTTAIIKTKIKKIDVSSRGRVENKVVNEKLKIAVDTSSRSIGDMGTNVDQKSTSVLETPSSASAKEGSSSKDQGTGTNDNSQFEKKTMSVMRGGEMVQVSYKVYIPTVAPALARRKLKR